MACEHTERRGFSIELDEAYADVIVMRWQEKTRKAARLEGGWTWAEARAERGVDGEITSPDVPSTQP